MEAEKTPCSTSISDEDAIGVGVGGKGKNKSYVPSSKQSKASTSTSTKKLDPTNPHWPTDLPPEDTKYIKSRQGELRDAMHQGQLNFCWAVAIVRNIEALILAHKNEKVSLSPQHLVNNIKKKNKDSGYITKYNEVTQFLKEEGLVTEKTCPYTGKMNEICHNSCQKSDELYKIKDLVYLKSKQVDEKQLIKLVKENPVVAVIDVYKSFQLGKFKDKDGIYCGQIDRKDEHVGRYAVLVTGFGSTSEGVHYWEIQNSWGTGRGKNGFGYIVRKTSRDIKEPSMFRKIIKLEVKAANKNLK